MDNPKSPLRTDNSKNSPKIDSSKDPLKIDSLKGPPEIDSSRSPSKIANLKKSPNDLLSSPLVASNEWLLE
jgi:hypothetical protein